MSNAGRRQLLSGKVRVRDKSLVPSILGFDNISQVETALYGVFVLVGDNSPLLMF